MTKAVVKKSETGCYTVDLYDNHGRFCFSLPDSNWFTTAQAKAFLKNAGITHIDLSGLPAYDVATFA